MTDNQQLRAHHDIDRLYAILKIVGEMESPLTDAENNGYYTPVGFDLAAIRANAEDAIAELREETRGAQFRAVESALVDNAKRLGRAYLR